ncbi:MAG: hypothetical protein BAJALOKI3v1_720018 [Promethearchaeota archaeon]|nr:MAG: hypothetical protein BAJALOKI3v1_720018 [Candidatus Lokiarchaeota archaeon]
MIEKDESEQILIITKNLLKINLIHILNRLILISNLLKINLEFSFET